MIKCILINENDASEINIKKNNIIEENLYKKCYLKNNNNFLKINSWDYKNNTIELWGKNKGLNKFKSKYNLFINLNYEIYGKSIFIMKDNKNEYVTLNIDNFKELEKNIIQSVELENNELIKSKENESKNSNSLKKNIDNNIIDNNDNDDNDNDNDNDNDSISSFNSELTYDVYNYLSDNSENNE
jgi:hypothetical protein